MQKYTVKLVNSVYSKKFMVQFIFSIFLCLVIHVWILQYIYYFADNFNVIMSVAKRKSNIEQYPKNTKFILLWNKYNNILRRFRIKSGLLNCSVSDCVFTDDKNLLYGYTRYHGIIFNEFALNSLDRPNRRSNVQLYIFGSQKSSYDAPACDLHNENFFNLTFTYRLDSDVLWSYIVVRNLSGETVAPKASVNWKKSLTPVSSEIKSILVRKRKAAVWLVNHENRDKSCSEYVRRLQEHLFHYSLKVDVYGQPPVLNCPNNNCRKAIRNDYYFYLAFESSVSVDYVTGKILKAYNNFAVPIVYGGANYSRFLPPGSYINARDLHPYNLASVMLKAIKNPVLYEAYFRWRNLYTIHDSSKSHTSLCNLCETVHRYSYKINTVATPAKTQFRRWWNGLSGMKWCLSEAYRNATAALNPYQIFHIK